MSEKTDIETKLMDSLHDYEEHGLSIQDWLCGTLAEIKLELVHLRRATGNARGSDIV